MKATRAATAAVVCRACSGMIKLSGPSMDGLEGIVAAVKNTERKREQLRVALEKIQAVLADALA